ncbi:MAG: CHASE domain-containing protein [Pseudomonadota bacterium]
MTYDKNIAAAALEKPVSPNAALPQPPSRHWTRWANWLVFVLSLAITLGIWNESRTFYTDLLRNEFHAAISETRRKLDDRIIAYTQVLRSSAALFAASGPEVSRKQWHDFIKMQELDRNYPAIPAVAFARSLSYAELDGFIEEMQSSGVKNFALWPPGKRERYVVNSYAEPFIGGNVKALGYDMWQDNDRRLTMERAAESGQPMITERTTLKIDEKTNPVPAFIMYLPVRIENEVFGYVLCPFRMPTLMQDLLGQKSELITLDIYDGTEPAADKLFFQSDNGRDTPPPRLTEQQTLEIGGRKWTLQFATRAGLEIRADSNRPYLILVSGLAFSLLLFIITWSLGRTKARAEAIALDMTRSLSESQNLLQGIVDNSPTLIYKKDLQGRYVFVNRAWNELFHSSLEDVIGKNDLEIFPEEHARRYLANDRKVLESGEPLDIEEHALLSDGIHYYRSTKVAIRDHDGNISGLCGLSADITDRKTSEEKLRKTNEIFSLFMRYTPVYVFIKEVTATESRVLQASENFLEMVGIKGSEMIGKNMLELFPEEFAKKITADDWDVVSKGDILKIDEDLNGRNYTTIKFPLVQEDRTLLAGFTIDITERKQAELALRYAISLTDATLESTADGILIINRDGKIARWNQKFVDLWHIPQHLLDTTVTDPVLPHVAAQLQRPEEFLAKVMKLNDHPEESSVDTLHLADGRVFERYSQPQRVGEEIFGRFWSFRDITARIHAEAEQQHMEKQLLHAQKLESLGVLAGGIAHDFNNILTAIIGNADLALMHINKESPATENLHRIEKAAFRAADLAKQMLAYSGKGKFVVESINLNLLLEEMLHMLEVSISKKAQLRLNLHQPLPLVEADATQLRQIIMNLVINASEAIGDKNGVIAISSGCLQCDSSSLQDVWLHEDITSGFYVSLEITDTGCGMDKDTQARIFDPFFTTKFTGRGLGMAAVLGIIKGHKGAIKIYSEPDRGSTFRILLPATGKPAHSLDPHDLIDTWHGSGTVLLVDDEDTVLDIGSEMLRELGFTPITASDGQVAIDIFNTRDDIRFVILDLTMPRMDGEQCFRELRQLQPDMKIMMSSGYSEHEVSMKFVGKGLTGFVQKPYTLSTLKEAIKDIA